MSYVNTIRQAANRVNSARENNPYRCKRKRRRRKIYGWDKQPLRTNIERCRYISWQLVAMRCYWCKRQPV